MPLRHGTSCQLPTRPVQGNGFSTTPCGDVLEFRQGPSSQGRHPSTLPSKPKSAVVTDSGERNLQASQRLPSGRRRQTAPAGLQSPRGISTHAGPAKNRVEHNPAHAEVGVPSHSRGKKPKFPSLTESATSRQTAGNTPPTQISGPTPPDPGNAPICEICGSTKANPATWPTRETPRTRCRTAIEPADRSRQSGHPTKSTTYSLITRSARPCRGTSTLSFLSQNVSFLLVPLLGVTPIRSQCFPYGPNRLARLPTGPQSAS